MCFLLINMVSCHIFTYNYKKYCFISFVSKAFLKGDLEILKDWCHEPVSYLSTPRIKTVVDDNFMTL